MVTFKIIDAIRFRKFQNYRYYLYYFLILLAFLINQPKQKYQSVDKPNSFAEMLGIDISIFLISLLVLGTFALWFHHFSKQYKILGNLIIDEQMIKIETEGNSIDVLLSQIKNLEIERGATWHYLHKENYLVKFDNWIKITTFDFYAEYEFCIESEENNRAFDVMITNLRHKIQNFSYKSI